MRLFFKTPLEKSNLNRVIKTLIIDQTGMNFVSFNNRKHKFTQVLEDRINHTLILHVMFNSGNIRITNQSLSNLHETAYPKSLNATHIHFPDCPLLNLVDHHFDQFDPKYEYSLKMALNRVVQKSATVLKKQRTLISLSRKGIEKGMEYNYPTTNAKQEFYLLLIKNKSLVNWHDTNIKSFYLYLFKELDLGNSELKQKEKENLVRLIIEIVLEKKCMNFAINLNN